MKSAVQVPREVVFPLFMPRVEKGISGGENHDKRTLDQRVESGVKPLDWLKNARAERGNI